MRRSLFATLTLAVALVGCDEAGPDAPTTEARKADAGFLITTVDLDGNRSERRQDKVAVCHYDDEAGSYELLSVGAPALDAHLRHGDGTPNDPVPDADATFGADCEVVPDLETGCSVERVVNPDGTVTTRATAILGPGVFTTGSLLGKGANGTLEMLGFNDLGTIFDGEERVGGYNEATFAAGSDDVIGVAVSDGSNVLTCGPYPVFAPDPS